MLMIRRAVAIIIIFLAVFPAPALYAQNSGAVVWHFAIGSEGQLFAYTADGTVNTLIEDGVGVNRFAYGWRVDERSALAFLRLDTVPNLYYLMPEAAQPLTLPPEVFAYGSGSLPLIARSDRYFLFELLPRGHTLPGLLVDLDTQTGAILSNCLPVLADTTVRFSADGQYLRYFSCDEDDEMLWTLWERNLATGEERAIFVLTTDQPYVLPDRYGERWLVRKHDSDTGYDTYTLVNADGSRQTLPAENAAAEQVYWQLTNDVLLAFSLCETDCALELYSSDGGEPAVYPLPDMRRIPWFRARPDETHLLVEIEGRALWFLEQDGEPTRIGFYDSEIFGAGGALSPDARWVLTVDDIRRPTRYQVWDNLNAEYVISNEGSEEGYGTWEVYADYDMAGFLISRSRSEEVELYRYSDGEVIVLPHWNDQNYFDVPTDDVALFVQYEQHESVAPGIYRYDLAAADYSLLVPNAMPIGLQDAPP